ncbi:MAG: hypothetical protein EOP88_28135 [Verrucomicrobiaceae bacterium]|nr:MAG: hypothetical protein EOP88_28135 [Verrucomicrobiaceae bacterium]
MPNRPPRPHQGVTGIPTGKDRLSSLPSSLTCQRRGLSNVPSCLRRLPRSAFCICSRRLTHYSISEPDRFLLDPLRPAQRLLKMDALTR